MLIIPNIPEISMNMVGAISIDRPLPNLLIISYIPIIADAAIEVNTQNNIKYNM